MVGSILGVFLSGGTTLRRRGGNRARAHFFSALCANVTALPTLDFGGRFNGRFNLYHMVITSASFLEVGVLHTNTWILRGYTLTLHIRYGSCEE